jgi:hypothetical protein
MSGCPHACNLSFAADVLHKPQRKTAIGQRASLAAKSGEKRPFNQMDGEDGVVIPIPFGRL